LAATGTTPPVLAARAATEAQDVAKLSDSHARRHAIVPMQADDPVGVSRLRALVGRTPAIV
jgi:arsenite/tail-anchored protein-transporting ATPase